MATTAGSVSIISIGATVASVSAAAATGGTTPYTYQWHRSTTDDFTPGSGNSVAGATSLAFNDTGLIPGTMYYYKMVSTDDSGTPVSATSTQLEVETSLAVQNPNQFTETGIRGKLDLQFNVNTVAVQIDASETGTLYAGTPVKMYDSANGIPKVVACSADSDDCLGFINFNIKDVSYVAGDRCEISMAGNCMYLYATGAIARGARVCLDLANNGVKAVSGSGGEDVVGWAFDKASAMGALIRVMLSTPSFRKDA